MKTIAVANLKGGVAKSTTTMMLSESLALHHGKRVLVLDLDPQCNCSIMFLSRVGAEKEESNGRTLHHFLRSLNTGMRRNFGSYVSLNASDLEPLRKGNKGRVDLIPCCLEMWFGQSAFERAAYVNCEEPDVLLAEAFKKLLAQVQGSDDYILFDCPPGFSTLARAGLRLSDAILSPTIPDQVSVRSLRDFHEVLVNRLGLTIPARYVLVTKFSPQNVVHKFMLDRLRRDYNVLGSP